MQFRPVMPQRRKASESPAPPSSNTIESSNASSPSSHSGIRGGRGRGRGGARPPRQPVQMTASGPFALGPSARPTGKKIVPLGPGGSSLTPAGSADSSRSNTPAKLDPDRASYRNPDKLKDAEQYSDPEDGDIEIVDLDEVHILDELAPRALPRVAEKESKKDKQKAADARQKKVDGRILKEERDANPSAAIRVKSEDPDDIMASLEPSSTVISSASVTPQPEDASKINSADALDLSESEGEELMDDLVDDFVFHDDDDVNPENRLYLFQFPQLFPHFKPLKKSKATDIKATTSTTDASAKRRNVSFAEGTTGGPGLTGKDDPSATASSSEIDSDSDSSIADSEADDKKHKSKLSTSSKAEGLIGKLNVYRDGRVFLRFGQDLVMEVTGGSQSTFLQQVMLLDSTNSTATNLGELHRKFIVSPEVDCMLNDISLYDEEVREREERRRKRDEEKAEADRMRYGGAGSGFGGLGGR